MSQIVSPYLSYTLAKTTYMLRKELNFETLHEAWSYIWGLKVPPKIRHFLWRMGTGTLPVCTLLKQRHLIDEARCPWCDIEEESVGHALFNCVLVVDLWVDCGCIGVDKVGGNSYVVRICGKLEEAWL